MSRVWSEYAYGDGPRNGCWWDETCPPPDWPRLRGAHRSDVAIVGGGFTGISAALHLAEAGADVILLEAQSPGWGASGRNSGFRCLGGGRLDEAAPGFGLNPFRAGPRSRRGRCKALSAEYGRKNCPGRVCVRTDFEKWNSHGRSGDHRDQRLLARGSARLASGALSAHAIECFGDPPAEG